MSRVTTDVIGRDPMSDQRDGRSDLVPAFSQVTALPSHLGPPLEPTSHGVTQLVTPPDPEKKSRHFRRPHIPASWKREARRQKKRRRIVPAGRRDLPPIIAVPVFIAQILMAAGITLATVASIVVSWRDLYEWGINHRYGGYAVAVPLMVDTFIVIGEMALFILVSLGFTWKEHKSIYAGAAFSFLFGLTLSVYGNVGHLVHADATTRGGFALPPAGAALGLAIGLAVLKLIAAGYDNAPASASPDGPPAGLVTDQDHASILVPLVAHQDKVAHPVAHPADHGADGPKTGHRPVNGASRAPRVRPDEAMVQAARQHLALLRRKREPWPSDRKLAESHFNPSGKPGKGNRRAARRVLDEYREAP
jgi:hypothetical protein